MNSKHKLEDLFTTENGPQIAVVDGVFLPAENPEITVTNNYDLVRTNKTLSSHNVQNSDKEVTVEFQTRRDPQINPLHNEYSLNNQRFKLFNNEYVGEIDTCWISFTADCSFDKTIYNIEIETTEDIMIEKR